MKRRLFMSAGSLLLAVMVVLAGCSKDKAAQGDGGSSGKQITLELWDNSTVEDDIKLLDKVYLGYSAANPNVKLKIVHGQTPEKGMAAVTAGNPPDLFWFYDTQTPIPNWAESGALLPLDDYMMQFGIHPEDYIDAALKTGKYNGKTYALPITAGVTMLYFDKDALDKEGLTPPKTWDELIAAAQKLTKFDASGKIERLGFDIPSFWVTTIDSLGGKLFDDKGNFTINTPENVNALNMVKKLVEAEGGWEKIRDFRSGYGDAEPIVSGKVAMAVDGDWKIAFVNRADPQFAKNRLGHVPMPGVAGKPETQNLSVLMSYNMGIPKGAKNPEEAMKFLKWMKDTNAIDEVCLNQAGLPVTKSGLEDKIFEALPGFDINLNFFKTSQNLIPLPSSTKAASFETTLANLDTVLSGSATPGQALSDIAAKLQ